MNKKNLFLSVPLAAGIALAGCSDEEGQEDTIMEEDNTEQTDENMNDTENNDNTEEESSIDDEGSDEDNEGMLNEVPEDPYGEGTDEPDLDTDEDAEEF
ncbi:hypothetical protein FZC78_17900 [Rossellomorea vietnamensis]|uniref:Uncharacterized protein n=1 Tax=Rossellomorea vietnamensis TaxID=218284 RepID=A0A5D4NKR8_9BACI|nr:hypothetical protein [Rossellomorea vietnamensis]TYS14677.1 hypothetical protein FZC78_17900 [Rossellomorea vietnamensis]